MDRRTGHGAQHCLTITISSTRASRWPWGGSGCVCAPSCCSAHVAHAYPTICNISNPFLIFCFHLRFSLLFLILWSPNLYLVSKHMSMCSPLKLSDATPKLRGPAATRACQSQAADITLVPLQAVKDNRRLWHRTDKDRAGVRAAVSI